MTIANQNVDIYRGDTATITVALTDVNGDPFALSPTGMVKYRMARTADDLESDTLVRKELNNGIIINDSVAEITLSATDTDWPSGFYYHELKVFDLGDVATAMTGWFVLHRSLKTTPQEMAPSQLNVIVDAQVV